MRHADRRLLDKREYPDGLLMYLGQSALRRLCLQSAPFTATEPYLGGSMFIPSKNVQEYKQITYADYLDEEFGPAPEYIINDDMTVSVDDGTLISNSGKLMFKYWYIPSIQKTTSARIW